MFFHPISQTNYYNWSGSQAEADKARSFRKASESFLPCKWFLKKSLPLWQLLLGFMWFITRLSLWHQGLSSVLQCSGEMCLRTFKSINQCPFILGEGWFMLQCMWLLWRWTQTKQTGAEQIIYLSVCLPVCFVRLRSSAVVLHSVTRLRICACWQLIIRTKQLVLVRPVWIVGMCCLF